MTTPRADGQPPLSTADLAVYLAGLAAGLALTHAIVGVVDDGRITALGGVLLAGVAAFIALFMYVRRAAIAQQRYGYYLLHVIAFLLVNGSFQLHALVADRSGWGAEIAASWRGPLLVMPLCWAVGLLVHTLGAVATRGYEHVAV